MSLTENYHDKLVSTQLAGTTLIDVRGAYRVRVERHASLPGKGSSSDRAVSKLLAHGKLCRGRKRNGKNVKSCGLIS